MIEQIDDRRLELEVIYQKLLSSFKKGKKIKFYSLIFCSVLYLSVPGFHIPALELINTRMSGVMEQRLLQKFFIYYPSQSWINYDKIPNSAKQGVIAMEDGLFMEHKGIDWQNLNASIYANRRRGKIVRGGSTITMQLAKNIYLTTRRNYFRKAKEILIAVRMEKEISKKTILEQYLNIIELGNGIFGINTASEYFFKKPVSELRREEVARLIAIIPSPLKNKPTDNKSLVLSRKGRVLARMNSAQIPED
ncbi:MAG: monofunctional biosynthetic peptidoglycan transglycosylase [Ignavibacteria bacterium]|nr:monofunctional biosynthetic peptidoglycan transglycosylase [Ignavibacteria bacterium]